MRIFNVEITKKGPNGQIIKVDPKMLPTEDQIKFEMAAISLFDQIVEKDDCREAKELIKHIQYS